MSFLPDTYITERNFKIQESAHYALACLFGLPFGQPEVYGDGTGGREPIDWVTVTQKADAPIPLDADLDTINRRASLNIATLYMGGHAAECIADNLPTMSLVGAGTHDFQTARRVLELGGHEDIDAMLQAAWDRAVVILLSIWPCVLRIATEDVVVTGDFPA